MRPDAAGRHVDRSPRVPDDLFVVVSVLLLGTVALALLGLDAGTAFGGMGSSRHMTIAALVEPTVLVAVYALSIPVGTSALSRIVEARLARPGAHRRPGRACSPCVALAVVVVAETGRLPVDNPATHLELTMVHEAMVLESSGRDLAWLELGSWLRLGALLGLLGNLLVPWGIATQVSRWRRCSSRRWPHGQARGRWEHCSPPARCSWRRCGCSASRSCSRARSCSPSSRSPRPTSCVQV